MCSVPTANRGHDERPRSTAAATVLAPWICHERPQAIADVEKSKADVAASNARTIELEVGGEHLKGRVKGEISKRFKTQTNPWTPRGNPMDQHGKPVDVTWQTHGGSMVGDRGVG